MTTSFCTYFDSRYLARGLALYESLRRWCDSYQLWCLCLDDACHRALTKLNLEHVHLISLAELLQADPELREAAADRTLLEFYFTCTPVLPWQILQTHAEVEWITYLDADLYFYADPAPLFTELAGGSVGIIPHRYTPDLEVLRKYGIYNVGWLSFRNDERGRSVLNWYRQQCLDWCKDSLEADRYADQKYLDDWPQRWPGVVVLNHKGANLASWNLENYVLGRDAEGFTVDGEPLLFFHFHSLTFPGRQPDPYGLRIHEPHLRTPGNPVRDICTAYLNEVHAASQRIKEMVPPSIPLRGETLPETLDAI